MKRTHYLLILAVVGLIALGTYYYVAVVVPANNQAAQISNITD